MNMWKGFKVSLLFIVVVCVMLLSGCNNSSKGGSQPAQGGSSSEQASKSQPVQAGKTPEAQAAKPAQPKITVTPPEGWEPVSGSTALAQYIKSGSSFIVTSDIIPSEAKEPDAYVSYVKQMYQKTFKDSSFEDPKKVTVAGMEGRMLTYSYNVSGFTMKSSVYYVLKDGRAYTFTCGSIVDNFDELKGDFEAFMKSVKFE